MDPQLDQFVRTVIAGSFGALVGASISGVINYHLTRIQFRTVLRDRDQMDLKNERALLQVFQADLGSILFLHRQVADILNTLEDSAYLSHFVPVTSNYFTVFENNVGQLGKVSNPELRLKFINVYQKAKSLVDSIRINNEFLKELAYWETEFKKTKSDISMERFAECKDRLVRYKFSLRLSSSGVMDECLLISKMIDDELKLNL